MYIYNICMYIICICIYTYVYIYIYSQLQIGWYRILRFFLQKIQGARTLLMGFRIYN